MGKQELKRELAVALYGARKLTLVQTAHPAALSFFAFQAVRRQVRADAKVV